MGSIFRRRRVTKDAKTGKETVRESQKFYGEYQDAGGRVRRVALCVDEKTARAKLAKIELEQFQFRGELDDPFKDHRSRPLVDHLRDYLKFRSDAHATPDHVRDIKYKIERIVETAKLTRICDITPHKIVTALARIEHVDGLSAQTVNHYLSKFKSFAKWLVDDRRTRDNLIAHLKEKDITNADRVRERRELTEGEIDWLLRATRLPGKLALEGPVYHGLTGKDRQLLYVVALVTGFRAKELGSLRPRDFRLIDAQPVVIVQSSNTKNRKLAEQPLPADLVPLIRECLDGRDPNARIWQGRRGGNFAANHRGAEILRFDLRRARAAWLLEVSGLERRARRASDFLCYETATGFGDFHAYGTRPSLAPTVRGFRRRRSSDLRGTRRSI